MSDPLEDRLRQALRRVDPPADLADRVLRQVGAVSRSTPRAPPRPARVRWWGAAAAACLALGCTAVVARIAQQRRGEQARHEVMWALRITGEELRHAKDRIHKPKRGNP